MDLKEVGINTKSWVDSGSPIDPILGRVNLVTRIDTYLFKIHSNIAPPLRLGLPNGFFPVGLSVKILKSLLLSFILATCPAHLNILDLISLTRLLGGWYNL